MDYTEKLTERLLEAKIKELGLIEAGIMNQCPLEDEISRIVRDAWDAFENEMLGAVRGHRVLLRDYPIIVFSSHATMEEKVVSLTFEQDEEPDVVLRFSSEMNRCGLLGDAERFPESYLRIIRICFEFYAHYLREIANLERACDAIATLGREEYLNRKKQPRQERTTETMQED